MRLRITLLIFILSAIRLCAGASAASKNDFRVEGYLTNMVTGAPLTESFKVEILMPDSTVIASGNSAYTTHQSTGPRNFYNVSAKGRATLLFCGCRIPISTPSPVSFHQKVIFMTQG